MQEQPRIVSPARWPPVAYALAVPCQVFRPPASLRATCISSLHLTPLLCAFARENPLRSALRFRPSPRDTAPPETLLRPVRPYRVSRPSTRHGGRPPPCSSDR